MKSKPQTPPKGAEYCTISVGKCNYFRISGELVVEKWDGRNWNKTDIPIDDLFTTWKYHELDSVETVLNWVALGGIVVSVLYFAFG